MKRLSRFLLYLIVGSLLAIATPGLAQSPTPPATPAPSPTPTQPPVIMIIQPTPVPAPTPPGSLLGRVWEQNKPAILLAFITAVITGVLVGVFLQRIAGTLADWTSRLFHFLFDRFASAPLLRLRYDQHYRQTLASALQKLASSNIVDREVRLDKVYVPVQLTEETRSHGETTAEDLIQWDEDRRRKQRQRAVAPWEAIRRFDRLVVLGEPGAGKTTYLTHLAFMCARQERLPAYTPIFIQLRDLAGAGRLEETLPQVLADYNFPNAGHFVRRQLAAGRCLILLDGLDEVESEAQHHQVVDMVQEFADRHVRDRRNGEEGNIVVVSSRTYSYEHGPQLTGFTKTMVMDFDDPAIERFVHNWFGLEALRPLAGRLLATLAGNHRFKELARNPLLLLLIVTHYERERNLPNLRADLYDECIETRIARWNERRGTHQGRFGRTDKRRMLRELALHLYRKERRSPIIDEEGLLTWLDGFAAGLRLPEGTSHSDLLDEVVRTSGLVQERAIRRYGFSHLTLQEYFVAEGAYRLGPDEGAALLGEHLADPRWQEVILLYCGLADDAGPLLARVLRRAEADGKEAWLQAGRCLAEGARRIAPDVHQRAAAGLVNLLRHTEADAPLTLSADESGEVVAQLQSFARGDLPNYVRTLLASDDPHDALLAARLLPETAEPGLRAEVSRRMADLARSEEIAERRVASAALGWIAEANEETVTALRAGLADADPTARAEAARALGRLGSADRATVADLRRLHREDPADAPRHATLEALLALGRAADVGMVRIPAGEFLLGSSDDDPDAEDREKPQHTVYLPAYYIDRTPVTNAQYRHFIEAGGYVNPAYWTEAIEAGRWQDGAYVEHEAYGGQRRTEPEYWDDPTWNGDEQPVVGVTWYEALAYARWAGKRLPTEAEWEKAASWDEEQGSRGAEETGGQRDREQAKVPPQALERNLKPVQRLSGSVAGSKIGKRRYPWGDTWAEGRANTEEAGHRKTTPVGQYSPAGDSPGGAADMAGNVWEWCSTRWGHDYPYDPNDGREDLGGGDNVSRVLRGGSWYNDRKLARCACRSGYFPWDGDYYWGFRCCCAPSSPSTGSES